jgi:hypothetical protein
LVKGRPKAPGDDDEGEEDGEATTTTPLGGVSDRPMLGGGVDSIMG